VDIKAQTSVQLNIGDQEYHLTREDAEALYQELRQALGKPSDPIPYQPYNPPLLPNAPVNPWTDLPGTGQPTYPSYPQIWCQSPQTNCGTAAPSLEVDP
jgi:hypothetical protein